MKFCWDDDPLAFHGDSSNHCEPIFKHPLRYHVSFYLMLLDGQPQMYGFLALTSTCHYVEPIICLVYVDIFVLLMVSVFGFMAFFVQFCFDGESPVYGLDLL